MYLFQKDDSFAPIEPYNLKNHGVKKTVPSFIYNISLAFLYV